MIVPLKLRRLLDAPIAFWGALALGLLALIAMFAGQALIGDDGEARARRSAQLDEQAATADARQKQEAAAAKSRRDDLMR